MKTFLNQDQVTLINGGYLSNKENKAPVYNYDFIEAQRQAEYVMTFAKLAKGKDFVGKKADSLSDLIKEVNAELASKSTIYVEGPKKVERTLSDKLAKEALAFIDYEKEVSKTDKINNFLQRFNILKEFEEFGLFFEQDIVKLNKIYTTDEIKAAVISVIDLID